MPILSMDKHGNIVQTDSRFNGAQGIGQVAEMVDQSDVTELSLSPEEQKKVARDRKAIAKIQHMNKMNQIKKYAEDKKKLAMKEAKRAAQLEKRYMQAKKQNYRDQLYKNTAYLAASQKPGHEIMSGVSGSGYSADGREPMLSRASQDVQPIVQANVAFGGDAQEWGNEMGVGYHSNTEVKKHGFSGLGFMDSVWDDPEAQLEPHSKYQRPDFNTIGEAEQHAIVYDEPMTTDDEYALRKFIGGNAVVNVYQKGHPRSVSNQVTKDHLKQQVVTRNNNWNHSSEMAKVISQGWGYSILDDGKSIKLVKIPYYWGMPYFVPDNDRNMYTTLSTALSSYWAYPYAGATSEFRNGSTTRKGKRPSWFQAFYPFIKAAAKEYAIHSDQYGVWQGRQYKNEVINSSGKKSSGSGFFKKLFANVSSDFNHPLVKQGLLK